MVAKIQKNSEKGFTLVEVAMLLVIAGLLVKPIIELYKLDIENKRLYENIGNFNTIEESINSYVVNQGRYPLPAGINLPPTDPNYGLEASGAIDDCTAWPTTNGICSTGGANPVLIGMVPLKELGINDDFAHDFWGNRILYAVTQSQATAYVPGNGGITTRGYDDTRTIVDVNTDIDIILISHGQSAQGAYLPSGTQFSACPIAADGLDSENCNLDSVFVLRENMSVFPEQGSVSETAGAEFYDDVVSDQRSVPVDLWSGNIADPDFAVTTAARIGIGTSDPQAKMHAVGDLLVANIQSDQICEPGLANCFDPIIIAGSETQMDCSMNALSGSQAVVDVGNSQVYCAVPVDSSAAANPLAGGRAFAFPAASFTRVDCADTAQLMTGINASGDPICVTP